MKLIQLLVLFVITLSWFNVGPTSVDNEVSFNHIKVSIDYEGEEEQEEEENEELAA